MSELSELLAKRIKAELPRTELEKYISDFLKQQTMCTVATTDGIWPRATPVEYYSEGLTLYIAADRGQKTKNLKINQNVSVAIVNTIRPDWTGDDWKQVRSLQITGKGYLLAYGDPGYQHALDVYNWRPFMKLLDRDPEHISRERLMLKVVPEKIEVFDFGLLLRGFSGRQTWTP